MKENSNPIQDTHVKEIVLVRHGQTTYNIAARAGNRMLLSHKAIAEAGAKPDHLVELTEAGVEQAKAAARKVAEFGHFDCFFDSDYRRSTDTLNCILDEYTKTHGLTVERRSHLDLREREPGYTFNMTATEANQYFPWLQEYVATVGTFYSVPPGGESIAQVCSRVHMFLNSLRRARAGKRVLIVTHGRVMVCFRYFLEKLSASDVEKLMKAGDIPNCQILQYVWNDAQHGYDKREHTWDHERYVTSAFEWQSSRRSLRPLDGH